MEEDERVYSDEDFRRILEKAEELAKESDRPSEPGTLLSLSEMKAAAAEAGLDPALVERAAHLISADSGRTLAGRLLRGMGWKRLGAASPVPLTQQRATQVLSALQGSAGEEGKGEATPYGLVWRTEHDRFTVSMYNEGRGSRIEISASPSRWLALSGWLGILSGWVVIGSIAPNTAGGFVASVVVGLGVAVGTWVSITHRARKRGGALLDAVSHTMQSLAELPTGSRDPTDSGGGAEGGVDGDGSRGGGAVR
jgi:hypothetical protein